MLDYTCVCISLGCWMFQLLHYLLIQRENKIKDWRIAAPHLVDVLQC